MITKLVIPTIKYIVKLALFFFSLSLLVCLLVMLCEVVLTAFLFIFKVYIFTLSSSALTDISIVFSPTDKTCVPLPVCLLDYLLSLLQ